MAYGSYTFGGQTLNIDEIPEAVRLSWIQKAINHKLSNEVVSAALKVKEKEGDAYDDEATTEELRKKMVDRIMSGNISLFVGGPRGSTVENIAWELAQKEAEAKLAPKGYWPKLDKEDKKLGVKIEDKTIEFNGIPMTREELTDMVFEKYKPRFMEEAKVEYDKRVEKAKLAKQNAVKTVSKVEESVEDLI
jgi:hypothetical protein